VKRGAIVLCGGKSSRMGRPKAMLPFGEELMLQRVVRLVAEVVPLDHIVVVAAAGQELPPLSDQVLLAHDSRQDQGPLEGLACGLAALANTCDAVYATGCDVPLLVPAFVEQMFELLGEHEIAVPKDEKFHYPLAAVYRTSVLAEVRQLLDADRRRPFFLFEQCRTHEVLVDELRLADAELLSLANCNTPEDYRRTLKQAGFADLL